MQLTKGDTYLLSGVCNLRQNNNKEHKKRLLLCSLSYLNIYYFTSQISPFIRTSFNLRVGFFA